MSPPEIRVYTLSLPLYGDSSIEDEGHKIRSKGKGKKITRLLFEKGLAVRSERRYGGTGGATTLAMRVKK